MLHSLLVAVAFANAPAPAPALFDIRVTASVQTDYSISFNGTTLKSGKVYRTEPLSSERKICIKVQFIDGDTLIENFVWIELKPGVHRTFDLVVPRVVTRVVTL